MKKMLMAAVPLAGLLLAASGAGAWEFRCRFIERVGIQDVVWPGNIIDASSTTPRSMRIQFGVFDDANGPAPAGGLAGWNLGTIAVSGAADNSDERRNNGRVSPFNFSPSGSANGNPPLPAGDPFTMLTSIDATLGFQSHLWACGGDGQPLPMPLPLTRGRNTFVSVYAFEIDPRTGASSYEVTAGGNLIAVNEWRVVETPTPPVCDPNDPDPDPGVFVNYAPLTAAPRSFTCTLTVVVPAPSALMLALPACLLAGRRARRSV